MPGAEPVAEAMPAERRASAFWRYALLAIDNRTTIDGISLANATLLAAMLAVIITGGSIQTSSTNPTLLDVTLNGANSSATSLGTQSYWIGTPPGQRGALPPEVEDLVNPYRVPVIV
jgi:hypothetical protein